MILGLGTFLGVSQLSAAEQYWLLQMQLQGAINRRWYDVANNGYSYALNSDQYLSKLLLQNAYRNYCFDQEVAQRRATEWRRRNPALAEGWDQWAQAAKEGVL